MRAFFSTLRFRITALYVAVFGITLSVFSATLYLVYERNQSADFDDLLRARALGIARSISIGITGHLEVNNALIEESGRLFPFQFGNEYIQIRSFDGRSLARSNNLGQDRSLPFDNELLKTLEQKKLVYRTLNNPGNAFWGKGNLRLLSLPLASQGNIEIILQLGVSTDAHDQSLTRLRTAIFFIGLPLTLLLAGSGGWWFVRRAFQPIHRIVSAAQNLGAERLEERLPVPEAEDELKSLSETLNKMLERLEKAFKSQQRFVADASHELKTPLTILKGELEVLRQQPRNTAEYETFLASASEELQRLTQITQNLLLLARADTGQPLEMKSDVRLDEIILEVVERLQPIANKAQVKLVMRMDDLNNHEPVVRGDSELLASLFFNLIHNAIKYSSAGQSVEISIQAVSGKLIVSVKDFGTGIRSEDLPHIFERFYRAENPTHREVSGTGLGLAISQWIAQAHHADLSVESKPAEGSVFRVKFG